VAGEQAAPDPAATEIAQGNWGSEAVRKAVEEMMAAVVGWSPGRGDPDRRVRLRWWVGMV